MTAPRVEIDRDAAAMRADYRAPHLEPLQDRLLPLAGGALPHFQMGRHVLDRTQKLEVENGDAVEEAMTTCVIEGERRHSFFDDGCTAAVLNFVKQRPALAFSPQQGARVLFGVQF